MGSAQGGTDGPLPGVGAIEAAPAAIEERVARRFAIERIVGIAPGLFLRALHCTETTEVSGGVLSCTLSADEGAATVQMEGAKVVVPTTAKENVLRGMYVRPLERPMPTSSPERVCAVEGCGTRLSIYNSWDRCWQHEPEHAFVLRVTRTAR